MTSLIWAVALLMPASPPPQSPCNLIEVWVDPVQGVDPVVNQPPTFQVDPINNPSGPTKTIQAAIDVAFQHLLDHYDATTNPDQQAVVHLMPGIYGPGSTASGGVGNGEHLPIRMRDRVHVRGVNARRCVIRGANWKGVDPAWWNNLMMVFWPRPGTCSVTDPDFPSLPEGFRMKQVLVDFTGSGSKYGTVPADLQSVPWPSGTAEVLEGVTFQGGDVQVLFGFFSEKPLLVHGHVANNLFDMRSGLLVENGIALGGPSIGLMVQTSWMDDSNPGVTGEGYLSQQVLVAGNTFLMAERIYNASETTWVQARPGAVGVLDTGYPVCSGGDLEGPKGVNRIGLQNNLLRTFTNGEPKHLDRMAMVGVSSDDARLNVGGTFLDTNAYGLERCGDGATAPFDAEHSFYSPPVPLVQTGSVLLAPGVTAPLWNGSPPTPSIAPATPAVAIWDGNAPLGAQFDPLFVGEYLRTVSPAKTSYRDWRLLPGSPLQNMGRWTGDSAFASGAGFEEPECETLRVSVWDHESYGNPRIVDSQPDIGFDEVQLGVMAGSYANHSYSHNRKGSLNPQVVDEQDSRFLFLRASDPVSGLGLVGRTLKLISNEIVPTTGYRAWTKPPGSLTPGPVPQSNSPAAGYDLRYTEYNPSNAVPWMQGYPGTVPSSISLEPWMAAPGQALIPVTLVQLPADDEGVGFASWVNVQPLVIKPGTEWDPPVNLWGSMQPEYR